MRRRHSQLNFAGSVHFVTTVTLERGRWFVNDDLCQRILTVLEHYRAKYQVDCFGVVLMPDHLHILLRQNDDGDRIPQLMRGFKQYTSRNVFPVFGIPVAWRNYYDDVPMPTRDAALSRLEYLLNNPVRAGLALRAEDYSWLCAGGDFGTGSKCVTIAPI